MAGLVQYNSSDDEDGDSTPPMPQTSQLEPPAEVINTLPDSQTANEAPITMEPQIVGPMMPQDASAFSLPEPEDEDPQEAVSLDSSNIPYSEYRSRLRELTYPTVPKMDFAPSPPGSPAQQVTAKVNNILRLKKNDVHFNSKMEQSSAFHNPAISQKLMAFAEIDEKQGQYATVLTKALWDPTKFPDWAYITPLYEAARLKPRPAGRAPVFISAESSKTTYQPPQTSSAGGLAKRQKRKADSD